MYTIAYITTNANTLKGTQISGSGVVQSGWSPSDTTHALRVNDPSNLASIRVQYASKDATLFASGTSVEFTGVIATDILGIFIEATEIKATFPNAARPQEIVEAAPSIAPQNALAELASMFEKMGIGAPAEPATVPISREEALQLAEVLVGWAMTKGKIQMPTGIMKNTVVAEAIQLASDDMEADAKVAFGYAVAAFRRHIDAYLARQKADLKKAKLQLERNQKYVDDLTAAIQHGDDTGNYIRALDLTGFRSNDFNFHGLDNARWDNLVG